MLRIREHKKHWLMETLYFKCSFCGFRIPYVIGHLKIKFLRIG